jgi:HAMP domain-containing protein
MMTTEQKKYEIELLKNAIAETTDYIGEAVSMGNLAEAKELKSAVSEMRSELAQLTR